MGGMLAAADNRKSKMAWSIRTQATAFTFAGDGPCPEWQGLACNMAMLPEHRALAAARRPWWRCCGRKLLPL